MQSWTVISVVIGIIALMFAVFLQLNNSIDKKIESKLKDPEFIRKVADEVRLPFVIFDEDQSVLIDTGAMNNFEKIKVKKGQRQEVSEIIVSPKKYMIVAPLLESFDAQIEFENPVRGENYDFIYKKVKMANVWTNTYASGKPPKRKFRLQLVVLPEE